MVVEIAITTVVSTVWPSEAGQSVILAAQDVIVWIDVLYTVEVVWNDST